jgi:molybdopterin biosynthesis enzyme
VNSRADLVGPGNPLPVGAYLHTERSPADGGYAVISAGPSLVAEDPAIATARVTALVYAGTQEAAENAAVALGNAVRTLTGAPQPCGDTGVMILVHDNMTEPADMPVPPDGGEAWCQVLSADFVLYQPPD